MKSPARIAVIIPAYNEEASIAAVVDSVNALREPDLSFTPIVVNDCSRDTTGELIAGLDCVALHLPINLGIGGAVQTGVKFAFVNGYDLAVQIDGDGQHPPQYIASLARELWKNN